MIERKATAFYVLTHCNVTVFINLLSHAMVCHIVVGDLKTVIYGLYLIW